MKTTRRSFIQSCTAAIAVGVMLLHGESKEIALSDEPVQCRNGYIAGESLNAGDLVGINGHGRIVELSGTTAIALGYWNGEHIISLGTIRG